jgi:hypothetical protein
VQSGTYAGQGRLAKQRLDVAAAAQRAQDQHILAVNAVLDVKTWEVFAGRENGLLAELNAAMGSAAAAALYGAR